MGEDMVSVVVQQIKDAQNIEREMVKEECSREQRVAIDVVHHKYKSRVAILTQELQVARKGNQRSISEYEDHVNTLRAETISLKTDLEAAKSAIAETTNALRSVEQVSQSALHESQKATFSMKEDFEAQIIMLKEELSATQSGQSTAELTLTHHLKQYTDFQETSKRAMQEAEHGFDNQRLILWL
jgi:hypothetical protein